MELVQSAKDIFEDFHALPAILMPYYDPWTDDWVQFEHNGESVPFCRVRYLKEPRQPRGFKTKKPQRYGQPKNSGVFPYFPLVDPAVWDGMTWLDILNDPEIPIVVTEGEKKALRGCLAGYPTIGLGGVYNFVKDGELLPLLDRAVWKKRQVFLNYDSDARDNPNIQAAEGRLATELSTKRRANVFLTRLEDAEDGSKVGIDDLIAAQGEKAWEEALRRSEQINKSDTKVLDMNRHVCVVDSDESLYVFRTDLFMSKHHFANGSRFSTDAFEVPVKKGNGTKKVFTAPIFLKHELALRYDDVVFDLTTEERVVEKDGMTLLNRWTGWGDTEPGDVTPFLELTKHISETLQPELQDFLLKMIAYKVQNPAKKVPIAIFLIGKGGSGKSMWAKMIELATAPYGVPIRNSQLDSEFNGWIERAIFGIIDEAQGDTVRKRRDYLKTLISESKLSLNEKYRRAKVVESPTFYILTSNDRRAGAFEYDDRRMFIVDVPEKLPPEWYVKAGAWLDSGGAKHILHYLLDLDLKGWRPPNEAPLTAEKIQAYQESLTPVQMMAETMKTADENIVAMWCDAAMAWAQEHDGSSNPTLSMQASEVRAALRHMPIRPIYTSDELAKILPHLAWTLAGAKTGSTAAGELSRQLRSSGIRYLIPADDPRGFMYRGMFRQFLVVAHHDEMPNRLSQNEFERLIRGAPTYGQLRGIG